jgi:GLPGLI family protein
MYSQQKSICGEMHYKLTKNFGVDFFQNYKMIFNENESYSEEINVEKSDDAIKVINSKKGVTTAHVAGRKNITPFYFYNSKNGFFFRENLKKEVVIVKEDKHNWNWKLTNETKSIGSFNCTKATIRFRGKNYIAWFTNQIPVSYGPWKFKGLPGLILEVYDEDRGVYIETLKIKVNSKTVSDCSISVDKKSLKKAITVRDYIAKIEKQTDEFFARLSSKMGKGSKPMKRDKNFVNNKTMEIFEKEN